jgi:hypothetical protein
VAFQRKINVYSKISASLVFSLHCKLTDSAIEMCLADAHDHFYSFQANKKY